MDYTIRSAAYSLLRRRLSRIRPTCDLAVVVHVYYPEVWPSILDALSRIEDPYDLIVTVGNRRLAAEVRATSNALAVEVVPNVGRDVLPFIQISRVLRRLGYSGVLKLHTKRSVHSIGNAGDQWREAMLKALVPDRRTVSEIVELLSQPSTGVIGPRSYFYRIDVAGPVTKVLMSEWLASLRADGAAEATMHPERFGFFAGTMFWARLDSLANLLDIAPRKFQREKGQIDGTVAHVLERLMSVIPAVDGRINYSIGSDGVRPVVASDISTPAWFKEVPDDQ